MVRRKPEEYNWDNTVEVDETLLTKHFTKGRGGKKVEFFGIHHMVIRDTDPNRMEALDACYNTWQSREASAHYGVEGRFIRQFVWDDDTAWALANQDANQRSINVEHADATLDEPGTANDYLIAEDTWRNGAWLVAHLHKVHNLVPKKDVTVVQHNRFTSTSCPGPYLGGVIWDAYNREVQRVYNSITGGPVIEHIPNEVATGSSYVVRAGDTLSKIAANFRTSTSALAKINGISNPNLIQIGQKILTQGVQLVSFDQIVSDVIAGKYGNGQSRFSAIQAAGHDPVAVQLAVNKKLS